MQQLVSCFGVANSAAVVHLPHPFLARKPVEWTRLNCVLPVFQEYSGGWWCGYTALRYFYSMLVGRPSPHFLREILSIAIQMDNYIVFSSMDDLDCFSLPPLQCMFNRTETLERAARNFGILGNFVKPALTKIEAHMLSVVFIGQGRGRISRGRAKLTPGHGIARAKHQ